MPDEISNYTGTITSTDGEKKTYQCAGVQDQDALIYAGKLVEEHADRDDPNAAVTVEKNGEAFGPGSTVRDMITRAV